VRSCGAIVASLPSPRALDTPDAATTLCTDQCQVNLSQAPSGVRIDRD
jgi:hypothetical protein